MSKYVYIKLHKNLASLRKHCFVCVFSNVVSVQIYLFIKRWGETHLAILLLVSPIELCCYYHLYRDAHILKIHVLKYFSDPSLYVAVAVMLSTADKPDREQEREDPQLTLSPACICLCGLFPFNLLTVSYEIRADELNHVVASTEFCNTILVEQHCEWHSYDIHLHTLWKCLTYQPATRKKKKEKRCHLPHFSEQNLIKTFFFS